MKKTLICLALGALMAMPVAYAQTPDLNVSGAGARAIAMGGAFTAVADDATAVYYNPAGLAQLKRPEINLVGYFNSQFNDSTYLDVYSGETYNNSPGATNVRLNFGSLVYPLNPAGHNVILAASYHLTVDPYYKEEMGYVSESDGGFHSFSGFAGVELNRYLMFGAGISMLMGKIDSSYHERKDDVDKPGEYTESDTLMTQDFSGGPQFTVGLLGKLTPALKVGAMFKTVMPIDFEMNETRTWTDTFKDEYNVVQEPHGMKGSIDFPMVVSSGLSWRAQDSLTLACDYQLFRWKESKVKDEQGNVVMDNGQPMFDPVDSGQVHVGVEYLASIFEGYPTPLRLGFYTYPQPYATSFQQKLESEFRSQNYVAELTTRNYYTGGIGMVTRDLVVDLAVEVSSLKEDFALYGEKRTNNNKLAKIYLSAIYKFGEGI